MTGTGCVTSSAPEGWLPSAEEAQQQAFGGWIEVRTEQDVGAQTFLGEFIAVDTDTVYVLSDSALTAIPQADIEDARLFGYATNWGALSIWTTLGTLSTASHGGFLILSAPVWIIGGSVATAKQSRKPVLRHPGDSWEAMRAFARFPQGLPPGFAENAISLTHKQRQ